IAPTDGEMFHAFVRVIGWCGIAGRKDFVDCKGVLAQIPLRCSMRSRWRICFLDLRRTVDSKDQPFLMRRNKCSIDPSYDLGQFCQVKVPAKEGALSCDPIHF